MQLSKAHPLSQLIGGTFSGNVEGKNMDTLGVLLSMQPGESVRWKVSQAHKVEEYKYPVCGYFRDMDCPKPPRKHAELMDRL